jgi:hypothetical protein
MYTNLLFMLRTNASKLKVFVEKTELKFNDQGIASIALVGGQQYFLYCFASGKVGSFYELSVLEPKDIPLQIFRKIEISNEDKARYSFTLSEKEEYAAFIL